MGERERVCGAFLPRHGGEPLPNFSGTPPLTLDSITHSACSSGDERYEDESEEEHRLCTRSVMTLSFQGDEQHDNVPERERFRLFCLSMVAFSHDPPSFQGDRRYAICDN